MKHEFFLFCTMLLIWASCKQGATINTDSDNCTISEVIMNDTVVNTIIDSHTPPDSYAILVDLHEEKELIIQALLGDTLVPMEIMNEESTDPFKKYGFAFATNCYSCDGIDIYITDSMISLIGSYGEESLKVENKEITAKREITIEVENAKFIFSKVVDTVEIYKLKIEGNLDLNKGENMTNNYFTQPIDFFYTPCKELHKFDFHDCGEFDG